MAIDFTPRTTSSVIFGYAGVNQDLIGEKSIQIASGYKYQTFDQISSDGSLEKFVSLSEAQQSTQSYINSNNLALSRVATTDNALNQLELIANEVTQLITSRNNSSSGEVVPVDLIGADLLNQIASNLNVKFDGRYLFSGSKTDTPAVDSLSTSNIIDGNATATYYQGDSLKPSVISNSGQNTTYGILANEPAFQKLIGSINLAIEGHNENDQTKIDSAMDMANEATSEIIAVRAVNRSTENTLNNINISHEDSLILIEANLVDISQTDLVVATTEMAQLETLVQASFLAFQRLSQLKLSNFL